MSTCQSSGAAQLHLQLPIIYSKFSSYSLLKHVQYLVNTGNYEENNTFCQHDTSTFTLSFSPLLPTIETLHTSDWKKYQDFPLYTYSQSYLKGTFSSWVKTGRLFASSVRLKASCLAALSKSTITHELEVGYPIWNMLVWALISKQRFSLDPTQVRKKPQTDQVRMLILLRNSAVFRKW